MHPTTAILESRTYFSFGNGTNPPAAGRSIGRKRRRTLLGGSRQCGYTIFEISFYSPIDIEVLCIESLPGSANLENFLKHYSSFQIIVARGRTRVGFCFAKPFNINARVPKTLNFSQKSSRNPSIMNTGLGDKSPRSCKDPPHSGRRACLIRSDSR